MPPERLNGGAIRGSLPTARNDMLWGFVYTLKAAPVSRGGFHSRSVARLYLSSSAAWRFSSSLRGITVRYAASSSCSVG